MMVIMKEDINKVVEKIVKVAIREYDKEQQEEKKKRILHNTKLLMTHYNDLKDHVLNSISDLSQLESSKFDVNNLYEDDLYILSIKKSKTKTMIMVAHIDAAMDILKLQQIKAGTLEKYMALDKHFIGGETYEKIAEELNCGVITARRWVNEMLGKLGIFLFGIDGMKL